MGQNPSLFLACGDDCPAENFELSSALDDLNRRSDAEGLPRCYDAEGAFVGLECPGYRLPTEAEWEYAARAGTQTAFFSGDLTREFGCDVADENLDGVGWYCGNAAGGPHPVGLKRPNPWGLSDMHGNVWEWTQDGFADCSAEDAVDPLAPSAGSGAVQRGGSWDTAAKGCRAARRIPSTQPDPVSAGLRPARTL